MRATLLAFVVVLSVCSARLDAGDDPLMGTWKLNPSKSKLSPWQKNKIRKHEPVPGGIKITTYDESGKADGPGYIVKFDGTYYPASGSQAMTPDTVALKRLDLYTLEGSSKKNGKLAVTFRYEISKDGKTLTRTSKRLEPPGYSGTFIEVFEKQ
jgi:hypothetical protein